MERKVQYDVQTRIKSDSLDEEDRRRIFHEKLLRVIMRIENK